MTKVKDIIIIFFGFSIGFFLMIPLVLSFIIYLAYPMMLNTYISTGFGSGVVLMSFFSILLISYGLMLFIPVTRRLFYGFPWLDGTIKIFIGSFFVLTCFDYVLSIAYEVRNPQRHLWGWVIGIIVFIIGRGLLSFYFYKKPVIEDEV